jgi:membrane protease YdiL (CAAX protease family)
MAESTVVVGILVQVVIWRLVVRGVLPFWPATVATFASLGVAAALVGDVRCCRETAEILAAVIGLASGILLYAATRVVVDLAARHQGVARIVARTYGRAEEVSFASVLAVTLLVAVPGEELFWRGLALAETREATSAVVGAVLTWAASVGVNAAWGSAPLLAGAVVGGGLWTGLAVWSGGVLAPIASHLAWTGLMLLWPPRAARAMVPA